MSYIYIRIYIYMYICYTCTCADIYIMARGRGRADRVPQPLRSVPRRDGAAHACFGLHRRISSCLHVARAHIQDTFIAAAAALPPTPLHLYLHLHTSIALSSFFLSFFLSLPLSLSPFGSMSQPVCRHLCRDAFTLHASTSKTPPFAAPSFSRALSLSLSLHLNSSLQQLILRHARRLRFGQGRHLSSHCCVAHCCVAHATQFRLNHMCGCLCVYMSVCVRVSVCT